MNENGTMRYATVSGPGESTNIFSADNARKMDFGSLNLLLFSVGGVHFGVDAEQVAGIAVYSGEQADDLHWFHEELAYGDAAPVYCSPTVITIRTGNAPSYRVIIDSMEDIAEVGQNDIGLFPALLEPFVRRSGMWGILSRDGIMVLLVDFQLLLKQRRPAEN